MSKLTFEEACSAVADLFEAAPETWTQHTRARGESNCPVWGHDDAAFRWCAIGGVVAALGRDHDDNAIRHRLNAASQYLDDWQSAAHANDIGGRRVAIRMLRIASGELKP